VVESLSLCLESCLMGRLNRLIRRLGAPRLQRLAIYVSPDDPELTRMSLLELRNLPLLHLHVSNSCAPPPPVAHMPAQCFVQGLGHVHLLKRHLSAFCSCRQMMAASKGRGMDAMTKERSPSTLR
jgi:hypothetical protein